MSEPKDPLGFEGKIVEAIASAIWQDTYRHDTLLNWSEIKRGTMHHKRVMNAARMVRSIAADQADRLAFANRKERRRARALA